MKKLLYLIILFIGIFICPSTFVNAQGVGVNASGSNPDPSAILDASATNKGMLIPRVSLSSNSDVTTIFSPAVSLLVYNTNASMTGGSGVGFYFWNGTQWTPLAGSLTPASHGSQTFFSIGSVQVFTVPAGVTSINISAMGASGGMGNSGAPGSGAVIIGTFSLTSGTILNILVGQQGVSNPGASNGGGGGGGTFIWNASGNALLLAVAGGGGSGFGVDGGPGQITNATYNVPCNYTCGVGGTGGNGGTVGGGGPYGTGGGGAGAGWLSDGVSTLTQAGGGYYPLRPTNAGAGGTGTVKGGYGGGGGGASVGGGGGGGYNGGNGGYATGGGGGGSYIINTATNVNGAPGYQSGNGMVVISW